MPALIIQGSADTTVAPVNADFLARQFVLFNGEACRRARPCRRPSRARSIRARTATS
jgi:hypothetical protein